MLHRSLALALMALGLVASPQARSADDGFDSIFDGKTLEGWDGDPKFWSVEDGAITGRTTPDNPTKGNTFIVWDGTVGDFELTLDYKIVGGNSGIQYRSFRLKDGADKWRLGGYQADIDSKETYSGIVYGEKARGVLVGRGESCEITKKGKSCERFAKSADIQAKIKDEDWNSYRIVAESNHLVQYINGVKTAELVDNDEQAQGKMMTSGLLGLQLHQGPPMVVQFKNIRLKKLDGKKVALLPRFELPEALRPAAAPPAAIRLRIDEEGHVIAGGRTTANLSFALAQAANDVLQDGIVVEYEGNKGNHDERGRVANEETIRLTASGEGATLESSRGRVDVARDGSVTARSGSVGFDYANGRGRLSLLGFTAFEFGTEPAIEETVPHVPEFDLGEPGEIELGDEGGFGAPAPLETTDREVAVVSKTIEVLIDAKGEIRVEGVVTAKKDLAERLREIAAKTGLSELHLRADEKATLKNVTEVMGLAQKAGITQVSLGTLVSAENAEPKKIVFIAGKQSHGYGAHEHKAGCMLLADQLDKSGLPVETHVVTNGWPEDASILDDADCIVCYADGGGRHPFHAHIDEVDKLAKKGVGIVCIHYGVEIPKGKSGDAFLDWTGGFFEENWSVNPHWEAEYTKLPKHPTTNGVKPFKVNDEWYYHMRFRDEMQGVTPILTDLPPKGTLVKPDGSLARPDNAHNNNAFVRAAILERKEPQHMAWAREREDGGRGFGITGGHFHWNWGNDQMRKLMLNAIVWSAGVEVPKNGVETQPVTVEDLMTNQDYDPPGNFNPARIEQMLKQWNAGS